jgi:predicted nucleotidyltransferase
LVRQNRAREVAVHELVASRLAQIEALCRPLGVRRLDLFGSAAEGSFDPETSDVDVLAEFAGGAGFDYFGTYFALKEGLEQILGRPVDVVSATGIRNPYFREQVMRTRELLYAA